MKPLTEGWHRFGSHEAMWAWLNHHGFSREDGYGDCGTKIRDIAPEGWEFDAPAPWELSQVMVAREDNPWADLPFIDHREEP
jgi:hypothetical protein